MAFDPRDYPATWQEIRRQVRERSGDRCEGSPLYPDCRARNGEPHPVTGSRVVLTVAHLNHVKTDDRLEVMKHLCQRCHLAHDRPRHLAVQKKNREARKRRRQPCLPGLE